ncbi:MAG TPA: DUF11 domain-containing protein, partial [Kofleriaceae bacterium]|nr:DUF11 domain-containing protein [Kofleriaceae bacterium]
MRRAAALGLLALVIGSTIASSSARAESVTYDAGSYIIPMDAEATGTYAPYSQNNGMLKAYGLVYQLLHAGIPVDWVIEPTKAHGGIDVTVSTTNYPSGAVIGSHGYRGGPYVIAQANVAAAKTIIDTWLAANPTVRVHVATTTFTANAKKHLVAAPNLAVFADGNEDIAFGYLNAAGIPDSTGAAWPTKKCGTPCTCYASPDVLCEARVAGGYLEHDDGALFDASGTPLFCQMMSMHYTVATSGQALLDQNEVVAEYRAFLKFPVHLFAECQAVSAIENNVNGDLLTSGGYDFGNTPGSNVDYLNDDLAFAQIDQPFKSVGGSEPSFSLKSGSIYKGTDTVMVTEHGTPIGTDDVWMTGFLDGTRGCNIHGDGNTCPPTAAKGKVSYLGGHKYTTTLPITSNPSTNGTRYFLNSLFEAECGTSAGQPVITVQKSGPMFTSSQNITYTITYSNIGVSVALAAALDDTLPAGEQFVSASNGGTFANGVVHWNLGAIPANGSGSVTVDVKLTTAGVFKNKGVLTYKAGTTTESKTSNEWITYYGVPVCGDAQCNGSETCSTCPGDCG